MKVLLSFSCFLLFSAILACNKNSDRFYPIKASIKEKKDSTFLILTFNLKKDIVFDWKVTSEVCYIDEKDQLLASQDSVSSLINKLKHNQLVVENKKGKKKFFMNTNNCKEYYAIKYFESCYVDWFQVIKKQGDRQIKILIPNKESLKVSCNDKEVKLYYLFKPNKKQKEMGFKNEIMESAWIEVN